ncbi:MAG: pentapeptide repeat-containing protein [Chloroflexota bacterium]|nr:pentapeptide repeat-containing protein [Chloroflexota bacterium]
MDSGQFDRLAQRVGTGHRRQVLGAALSGIVALVGLPAATESRARKRKLKVEGPCGNGRIKDNRCKRDTQCCTGFCDKKKGKRPYGRCRCRKLNQSCQEDRNCCATAGQPMTCVSGACQTTARSCVPLGGACTTGGTACCTDPGANATCTAGICRDPGYCTTTLEAAGCGFSPVEKIWFCTGQYLNGVNLSGCDLTGADFRIADATNAILASTNLTNANFLASTVTGVDWENTTCPTGTNSDANGDTCCGEFIVGQVPAGCPAG